MDHIDIKRVQVLEATRATSSSGKLQPLCVGDVMTTAPACVPSSTSALDLVRLFHAKNFRHLLVTDRAGRLEGVISDRDVLRCLGPERRPNKKTLALILAAQLMSTDVVTVGPEAPLAEAVRLIVEQGIGCLPVMAGDSLVGILTNTDLHVVLETLLARYPDFAGQPLARKPMSANLTAAMA